jgi:hypothetical protein
LDVQKFDLLQASLQHFVGDQGVVNREDSAETTALRAEFRDIPIPGTPEDLKRLLLDVQSPQ